jgi:plasmid stabilization system protein ParE
VSRSVHPDADRDVTDAFRFYMREAGVGVARRFLAEFERVTSLLQEFPDIGTRANDERRAYPLTGFPYSVIYRRIDGDIRVLVFRHQSRNPDHGELRS